jgi:hypothetical protein
MDYFQKYKDLRKENHVFTFTGNLNFQDVILLKELIEKLMVLQNADNKLKRRVVNILIEALQNIHNHGGKGTNNPDAGYDCLLRVCKDYDGYILLSVKYVYKSSLEVFLKKLQKLDYLNLPELKQLYMEMLDRGEITDKGGAGVGLVKMFMDCKKNVSYSFYEVNEDVSFFAIELRVNS